MCGNGIRCLASHLAAMGASTSLSILTGAGVISTIVTTAKTVSVNMGRPQLAVELVPCMLGGDSASGVALDCQVNVAGVLLAVSAISFGNPHGVSCLMICSASELMGACL